VRRVTRIEPEVTRVTTLRSLQVESRHDELGVKYVIFEQKIYGSWTGWKAERMEDRGGPTANHMDHPHISFHGPE
jgi:hypothetical protein